MLLAWISGGGAAAGVIHDDGVIGSVAELTPERSCGVLRPKVDAAWHLHELTGDGPVGVRGRSPRSPGCWASAGQGSYAAGNAFLDALVRTGVAVGLPGVSLAWGPWAQSADGGWAECGSRG